ncbi:MAG TPA: HpnL family protein [Rhodospirillaceae bacterium]|nr:HpnL family protein [Rhodospirillaceae bacterium]
MRLSTAAVLRLATIALVLAIAWYLRGGLGDVTGTVGIAGWPGVAAVAAVHAVSMALCGLAWGLLLPGQRLGRFVLGRWVREGVSEIAAFLPLSGEVAGARLLTSGGLRPAVAGALTVVDVSCEVVAQFIFSLVGVGLWLWRHPDAEVLHWGLIGLAASVPVLAVFFIVQHAKVMGFLETLPSRLMPRLWKTPDQEAGVQATVTGIYRNRRRVLAAVGLHLLAWLVSTGEAFVALAMLGHPLALVDVLALESIIFAIRSAAFVIPGALGIQEGGYVLVGAALGLSPEVALAVSLLKRSRELLVGVPALLAWHVAEGRSLGHKA